MWMPPQFTSALRTVVPVQSWSVTNAVILAATPSVFVLLLLPLGQRERHADYDQHQRDRRQPSR